ncbi:MAG TPA: hypothetical protein DDZ51_02840 [Planctomycetaceae bacterium]|nr:hypothetical protein [Planctomycetaceae bacterium]
MGSRQYDFHLLQIARQFGELVVHKPWNRTGGHIRVLDVVNADCADGKTIEDMLRLSKHSQHSRQCTRLFTAMKSTWEAHGDVESSQQAATAICRQALLDRRTKRQLRKTVQTALTHFP